MWCYRVFLIYSAQVEILSFKSREKETHHLSPTLMLVELVASLVDRDLAARTLEPLATQPPDAISTHRTQRFLSDTNKYTHIIFTSRNSLSVRSALRSCVKVEVATLGSSSLTVLMVSVGIRQH